MSDQNNPSLEELFVRYSQDQLEAFDLIYKEVAPGLERYLRRRLKLDQEVQEVLQQVFLRLHRYRYRYNSKYLAWQWVFVVARSELLAFCRSQAKAAQTLGFEDLGADIFSADPSQNSDSVSNTGISGELLQALEQETDGATWELLQKKYIEEQTYSEIAQALGVSEESLRQKLSRALRRLRKRLRVQGSH